MTFIGEGRPLALDDITAIAGYLGCEVAAVHAVLAVETAGDGFGHDGRPIILNEPHVFYRELGRGDKRKEAVRAGLAYQKWGAKPYPKTQAERYAWLDAAMAIDEAAALRSCSWGLGQVMGFNHELVGFATVQAFVAAMTVSEGAQLFAMARFIVANNLQRHLRSKNWASFARGYNGSAYKKHGYDTKLANAYARRPADERYVPEPTPMARLDEMAKPTRRDPPPVDSFGPAPKPVSRPTEPVPVSGTPAWAWWALAAVVAVGVGGKMLGWW